MSQDCPHCGRPVPAGHRFCSNCGQRVEAKTANPPAPASEGMLPLPPTTSLQPVTYVVQRYEQENRPQEAAEPGATTEAPATPGVAEGPYAPFVPPAAASPVQLPSEPLSTAASPPTGMAAAPPPASPKAYDLAAATGGTSRYGSYAPPPSSRQANSATGTYAPYVSGAVPSLERPAPQRSWLMPVLLAGSAVLLVLVLASGYLLLKPSDKNTPQGQNLPPVQSQLPTAQSQLPANAGEDAKVKEVIRLSNEAQITAWRTLDVGLLRETYAGSVLTDNIKMINMLKDKNMYAVPANQRLDFTDVQVNGDTAVVRTVETWTVTFRMSSDDTIADKQGPDTLHEIYYLEKQNGKWMITNLQVENQPNATPTTVESLESEITRPRMRRAS